MLRYALALALLAPAPALAAGGPLNLAQGTAELGGVGTLNLTSTPGDVDLSILLAPQAGIFVADRLELFGGVSLFISQGTEAVGLAAGIRYIGNMGNNHWYAGGGLGYGQVPLVEYRLVAPFFWGAEVSVQGVGGFLFPLNKKVAVDIGARLNVYPEASVIFLPMGYLGVSAFFP